MEQLIVPSRRVAVDENSRAKPLSDSVCSLFVAERLKMSTKLAECHTTSSVASWLAVTGTAVFNRRTAAKVQQVNTEAPAIASRRQRRKRTLHLRVFSILNTLCYIIHTEINSSVQSFHSFYLQSAADRANLFKWPL